MKDDFRAAAQRIEASPLGRLMYGQKELFHSNLLAWFFDALPEAADETFREFASPGAGSARRVERERGHLDLVLRWPDRVPLVIENKVFSLPQRDQLEEYERATAPWMPAPALVLLSMTAPPFALGMWRHVRYTELAGRIRASLPSDTSYEVETMRRYADLVTDHRPRPRRARRRERHRHPRAVTAARYRSSTTMPAPVEHIPKVRSR